MKVVATFHPPSSVVGSVSCRLTSGRDVHHLAVATANRIEVFSAAVDGLKLECSADIWGRVVALKIWPAPDGKGADSLVALTDHPDPRLIRYTLNSSDEGETVLERKNVLSLVERIGVRESEFLHDVIVNSDGKTAIVSVYTGKLKVVEIDVTTNKLTSFDVICHEYNLLSVSFLGSEKSKHWLGMLYLDHDEKIRLHARELDVKNYELSPSPSVALRPCVPNLGVRTLTDPPPTLISIPKLSFDAGGESDGFRGGVLVIGGAKIRLFELTDARYHKSHRSDSKKSPRIPEDKTGKPRASIVWPWAEVTAWCAANEEGTRYLIGDAYGRIALLSLEVLSTHGIVLMPLGEISPSTSLSYITNQVFFLGSHFGDSQLVRITDEALVSNTVRPPSLYGVDTVESLAQRAPGAPDVKGKGRATEGAPSGKVKGKIIRPKGVYMEIVDTRTNIAPIMDAVLADTDGSGLPQVFTASGGKNTGSVRVVRNGADFADVAHIDGAGNFTGMFPLRQTCESQHDTFVLATDGLMTQLFRMSSSNPRIERVDPTEFSFVSNSPTLAAANMRRPTMVDKKLTYADSSWALQVTPNGVRIVDLDTQTLLSSWTPEEMGPAYAKSEIICADVNESQVLLALPTTGQNHLVLLGIDSGPRLSQKRQLSFSRDITTVSCAPETPGKPFATRVVVGFWDSRVEILSLRGPANTFSSYTPPSELSSLSAIPRSVLLHSFSKEETYLFAGLADGTVLVCAVKGSTLSDKRVFAMGAAPANLARCTVRGQIAIFGSGSRAAVFSLQSGSLQHSPVLVKGVTTAAPFSTEGWESSILISTQTHLVVGQVRAVNKMQIRTIPFGLDNPVKLAHDPVSKTLGVGCVKADSSPLRELEQPTESVVSSFKILDDTTHEVLSTFTCQPWEEITSVATYTPAGNDARTYYVLGTMFTDSVQRDEPTSGRVILLLPGKADGMSDILTAEATQRVNGCVYAILSVDGHIVAAMNSAVMLFKFKSGPDAELEHVYTWNHDYIVASLAAHGRRIFNGDAVHSVSALELTPARTPTGHTTLSTVARNYGPLWPTALGAWDQNTVIGANADLNLFSFEVQTTADGPRKITVLERDGFFHADDVINKFVQGSLNSADDEQSPELAPRQLYFTASGRIGVVLDMAPELSMKMYGLYRNLAAVLSSTQDTSHTKWRTPTGSRGRSDADEEARGFLDGDLLERFLDLAPGSEIVEKVMRGSSVAERLDMSYEQIRGLLETMQGMH